VELVEVLFDVTKIMGVVEGLESVGGIILDIMLDIMLDTMLDVIVGITFDSVVVGPNVVDMTVGTIIDINSC
jgi:hypothetical protein